MKLPALSARQLFFAVAGACAGLIVLALVLQHIKGISPCPLCILQRYAFVLCGLVALIAALHHPQSWGQRLYGAALFSSAAVGGGVSARQIWLQHNPPTAYGCGPGLEYMVSRFPLADSLPMIFRGEGDCSKIDWTMLNLSIAEWALLWFLLIGFTGLWIALRRTSPK